MAAVIHKRTMTITFHFWAKLDSALAMDWARHSSSSSGCWRVDKSATSSPKMSDSSSWEPVEQESAGDDILLGCCCCCMIYYLVVVDLYWFTGWLQRKETPSVWKYVVMARGWTRKLWSPNNDVRMILKEWRSSLIWLPCVRHIPNNPLMPLTDACQGIFSSHPFWC